VSASLSASAVVKAAPTGAIMADSIRLRTFKFGKAGQ
jgi:hypothetical protein